MQKGFYAGHLTVFSTKSNVHAGMGADCSRLTARKLSEEDCDVTRNLCRPAQILALQVLWLCCPSQQIQSLTTASIACRTNLAHFRSILETYLSSWPCFQEVACLALEGLLCAQEPGKKLHLISLMLCRVASDGVTLTVSTTLMNMKPAITPRHMPIVATIVS